MHDIDIKNDEVKPNSESENDHQDPENLNGIAGKMQKSKNYEVKSNSESNSEKKHKDKVNLNDVNKYRKKDNYYIEEPISIFRKRRKWMLNDNFLVSREESERRLQIGCLGSAILLIIVCTILVSVYAKALQVTLPIIITPNKTLPQNLCKYKNKCISKHLPAISFLGNKIPVPHIAVIYNDGSVYDVSLEESISPSRNLLLELPKEEDIKGRRYAYQDHIGTLYFISSTISRPIIQYYYGFGAIATLSSHKFKDLDFKFRLDLGTQVGNKFWLFGFAYHHQTMIGGHGWDDLDFGLGLNQDQLSYRTTYIWYTRRQKWIEGPVLFYGISSPWACTGINATSAVFVSYQPNPTRAYVYDFVQEQMFDYPVLPQSVRNLQDHFAALYALTTLIGKTQKRVYWGCLMRNIDDTHKGVFALVYYDLDQGIYGQWIVEHMQSFNLHPSVQAGFITITTVRGTLYSFHNFRPDQSAVSIYQNNSWLDINVTFSDEKYWPVFALPFYVRV